MFYYCFTGIRADLKKISLIQSSFSEGVRGNRFWLQKRFPRK